VPQTGRRGQSMILAVSRSIQGRGSAASCNFLARLPFRIRQATVFPIVA
jgi:hypothetical protein